MANSEDIEARLCAFIEGSLSPAERAEIERHLEAHPQHRQMIQDLIHTRNLIGSLPQANAPEDLCDGLQGQLERSLLLGGCLTPAQAHEPLHRPRRHLPHLAMVAAVCVLSLGFGSVLYYLLHAASHPATLAISQAAPTNNPSFTDSTVSALIASAPAQTPAPDDSAIPASDTIAAANTTLAIPTTQPSIVAPDTQPAADDASAVLAVSVPTTQPLAAATTEPTTQPALAGPTQPPSFDGLFAAPIMPTTLPFASDANTPMGSPFASPAQVLSTPTTLPAALVPSTAPPTTAPVAGDAFAQ
jgi:hypothetical protein